MLRDFPDCFDSFVYQGAERMETIRAFVDGPPPDLAAPIARENAKRRYPFSRGPWAAVSLKITGLVEPARTGARNGYPSPR